MASGGQADGDLAAFVRQIIREELQQFQHEIRGEMAELRRRVAAAEDRLLDVDLEPMGSAEPVTPRPRSVSTGSASSSRSLSPSPTLGASVPSLLQKVGTKVHRLLLSPDRGAHNSAITVTGGSQFNGTGGGPVTVRRNSGMSSRASSGASPLSVAPQQQDLTAILREGIPFLRITHNKRAPRVLKLDEEQGIISWNATKTSARVLLDRISEIYTADEARNYREEFRISAELASRWITIVHQRPGDTKLKALHMVMNSERDFDILITCLVRLVSYRREVMCGLGLAGEHFVDVHWSRNTDASHKELTFTQVQRLCQQLHVHCAPDFIRRVFDEADTDRSGVLDFAEFKRFVRLLKRRDDIAAIWARYHIGESREYVQRFLTDVQKVDPDSVSIPEDGLQEDEFAEFLLSQQLFPPVDEHPPEESKLLRPLNEYWICSSHNTYLMGRQVADASSVEACIRALQDGCRCLEIDCWDGPRGPLVYHGHSLTRLSGAILFDDVVEAVLKYGFISSPFPIILSLEIRCGEASQRHIVHTLRTVLAGLLVTDPLPPGERLPSPHELRHRILIKVKSASSGGNAGADTDSDRDDMAATPETRNNASKQPQRVITALADLGVYLSGFRFQGFEADEAKLPNHVFSFSERTLRSIMRDSSKRCSLQLHDAQYMARVYPSNFRIMSTNFDPIPFWKMGVQMVALNWQRPDVGMQLNSAFFGQKCGYVLKPAWMRPPMEGPYNFLSSPLIPSGERKVRIQILSAQQLPRPTAPALRADEPLSPFVTVELWGTGDDNRTIPQWKTPVVAENGFNPVWRWECDIRVPERDIEFACLRFVVTTGTTSFAFCTCRLASMLQGYRHLPLRDLQGENYLFSTLFIKIDF